MSMSVLDATIRLTEILGDYAVSHEVNYIYSPRVGSQNEGWEQGKVSTLLGGRRREIRLIRYTDGNVMVELFLNSKDAPCFSGRLEETSLLSAAEWAAAKRELSL